MKATKETADEAKQVLWLPSYNPTRAAKRMVARMPADPDAPVLCSYLGSLPSVIGCPDGTVAEVENARGTGQRETRQFLERLGGRMIILSARIHGKTFISIGATNRAPRTLKPPCAR